MIVNSLYEQLNQILAFSSRDYLAPTQLLLNISNHTSNIRKDILRSKLLCFIRGERIGLEMPKGDRIDILTNFGDIVQDIPE